MYNKLLFRFRSPLVSTVEHPIINKPLSSGITHHQSGAVLIISLVILLLLTLIGASSIQTTTLEEKMAGNWRDQDLAFQVAESALKDAEANTSICDQPTTYPITTADFLKADVWSKNIEPNILKDDFWAGIPAEKRFNTQCFLQPQECLSYDCPYNLITVRAIAPSTSAVVILQSTTSDWVIIKPPTTKLNNDENSAYKEAFQDVLDDAKRKLNNLTLLTFTEAGTEGFYSETSTIPTIPPPNDISTISFWSTNPKNTSVLPVSIGRSVITPIYIIQKIPTCSIQPCVIPPSDYRITVKATDASTGEYIILQATYSPASTSTSGVRKSWQQFK